MSGDVQPTKTQIVERLNLKPHETCNGYFAETFRDTSIVLPRSHLPPNCKVDHHVVELNEKDGTFQVTCVGPDVIVHDHRLQHTVPPNVWFGSIPTKDCIISSDGVVSKSPARDAEKHYSLVGCTCAPGFHYEDSELARRSELASLFPGAEALISLLTSAD